MRNYHLGLFLIALTVLIRPGAAASRATIQAVQACQTRAYDATPSEREIRDAATQSRPMIEATAKQGEKSLAPYHGRGFGITLRVAEQIGIQDLVEQLDDDPSAEEVLEQIHSKLLDAMVIQPIFKQVALSLPKNMEFTIIPKSFWFSSTTNKDRPYVFGFDLEVSQKVKIMVDGRTIRFQISTRVANQSSTLESDALPLLSVSKDNPIHDLALNFASLYRYKRSLARVSKINSTVFDDAFPYLVRAGFRNEVFLSCIRNSALRTQELNDLLTSDPFPKKLMENNPDHLDGSYDRIYRIWRASLGL